MAIPHYLHHLGLLWLHWPPGDTSVRIVNIFEENEIRTVADLVKKSAYDLLKLRNFGELRLCIVRGVLAKVDLKLRGE